VVSIGFMDTQPNINCAPGGRSIEMANTVEPVSSHSGNSTRSPVNICTRRGCIIVCGLLSLCLVIWYSQRLTQAERLLIGIWTNTWNFEDGSTTVCTWEFRPDRTIRIHNLHGWVETAKRKARNEVVDEEHHWHCQNETLVIVPKHPLKRQLRVEQSTLRQRLRNITQGTDDPVMDPEGSNGRLAQLKRDSFTVHWWNPGTRAESSAVTFERTKTIPSPQTTLGR
jgi:hypothetical protein